jgi:PAS domain S-box-containing protein
MQRLAKPSQRLQAALELAAVSAFDVDGDLRYVWAQKPPVGLREADMLGKTAEEIYEPAVAALLTQARKRILREGTSFRTEMQVHREGLVEWVDWIGGPLRDADGRIVGVTNLAIDITDRKTSEMALRRSGEAQRLLVALQDATPDLATDIGIKSRLLGRIANHFQASRCVFADISLTDFSVDVDCDHAEGVRGVVGRHRLAAGDTPLMRQLLAGKTVVLTDIAAGILRKDAQGSETIEPVPGEAWMTLGYWDVEAGALLCVPVLHEGNLVAALSLRHSGPHAWSDDEVQLVEQITQRVWTALESARAQQALRESRDVLALAMRGGRMGAWSREFDSDKSWWSRELEEIFGLEADGFAGTRQDFLDLLHPDDSARVQEALEEATRNHRDYVVQYRFRHRSGEWRWMEGRGRTVYRNDGTPSITYGLGIDITERKVSEDERRRLNAELAQSLRRKDEFLATLAHELRNPLAPIVTALEVLRLKAPADPQMRWSRDVIERQVRHMTRLVDDLLDVARISTGKAQLRIERVELSGIVHHAVEGVRSIIDTAGHSFSVSLPPGPLLLDADPTRLSQILANLLSNAAKYTPPRGNISLAAREENGEAVISVSDDGIGLSSCDLESIFSMFAQVAPAIDRSQGGLGIGLALSRGLVELHGGAITATSPGPRQGSTFTVRLPLAARVGVTGGCAPRQDGARDLVPLRVLVVDDNLDAAESLAMLLQMDGHVTAMAHDGQRALEMAQSFNPQVILLDIGLPLMNGYEVARRVREQAWGRGIKLIAVTGWGQEKDRQQAVAAGFDHHLTKPLDPGRLAALLDG